MPFGSLWLPVVVSVVAVFILSALLHMVLKYHRADYKQLAEEDAVAQALRKAAPSPGVYAMPYCTDPSQMKDPAVRKKFEDGPIALLNVMRNGPPNMAKNLIQWFLFCFLVSFFAAYVARHTLNYGADGLQVLRIITTIAFVGYGFGPIQSSIWGGIPWSNTLRGLIDAAVYSLVTGFAFKLLWPAA
jgi:hypothetical protein